MNRSLGQILVNESMLTQEQVDEVINFKTEHRCHFGDACIQLGFLNEDDVLSALAIQLYMPKVDLNYFTCSDEALEIINKDQATEMKVIPLFLIGNTLTIATSSPMDIGLIDRLKKISRKEIQVVIASEKKFSKLSRTIIHLALHLWVL